MNSPEDGPVGPKHVQIRQYINKIEIVTSVGFYSIFLINLSTLHHDDKYDTASTHKKKMTMINLLYSIVTKDHHSGHNNKSIVSCHHPC